MLPETPNELPGQPNRCPGYNRGDPHLRLSYIITAMINTETSSTHRQLVPTRSQQGLGAENHTEVTRTLKADGSGGGDAHKANEGNVAGATPPPLTRGPPVSSLEVQVQGQRRPRTSYLLCSSFADLRQLSVTSTPGLSCLRTHVPYPGTWSVGSKVIPRPKSPGNDGLGSQMALWTSPFPQR